MRAALPSRPRPTARLVAVLLAVLGVAVVVGGPAAGPAEAYAGAPWFQPSRPYTGNFPDPSIVVDGGTVYAYGTATGGSYVPVMRSTDLKTWTARPAHPQPSCVGGSVDPYFNDALPCPARWSPDADVPGRMKKGIWAPGAARIGGRYVLFYAARHKPNTERFCISVATSSSPMGPFTDNTSGPIVCDSDPNGSIDPQPFVDADGKPYLLWVSEGVVGSMPKRIWARQLDPSGTAFAAGSTKRELLRTSQGWEGNVIENPAMLRHQGKLYLFYSGNEWRSGSYATGYATCSSVLGPCTKHGGNPVLASRGGRLGPGGATPFVDPQGRFLLAYHWWNAPYTSYPSFPACEQNGTCTSQGQRRLGIAQVSVTSGGLRVGGDPRPRAVPRAIDPACPTSRVAAGGFADTGGNTHGRAIDCVSHWAIAKGIDARHYQPQARVTREQMASFIARLLEGSGQRLPSSPPRRFSDTGGSTHALAIDQLAALGVVSGRGDGTYGPREPVERGQMATFLVRAAQLRTGSSLAVAGDYFGDDDGNPHESAVNKAATAGLTAGRPDGSYGTLAVVPRDQMASFLARTLALLVERGVARVP